MSKPVFNFSAGPAALPKSVMDKLSSKIFNFDRGMSILEISHRSQAFKEYTRRSESSLRRLLTIGDEYEILCVSMLMVVCKNQALPRVLMNVGTYSLYENDRVW